MGKWNNRRLSTEGHECGIRTQDFSAFTFYNKAGHIRSSHPVCILVQVLKEANIYFFNSVWFKYTQILVALVRSRQH